MIQIGLTRYIITPSRQKIKLTLHPNLLPSITIPIVDINLVKKVTIGKLNRSFVPINQTGIHLHLMLRIRAKCVVPSNSVNLSFKSRKKTMFVSQVVKYDWELHKRSNINYARHQNETIKCDRWILEECKMFSDGYRVNRLGFMHNVLQENITLLNLLYVVSNMLTFNGWF